MLYSSDHKTIFIVSEIVYNVVSQVVFYTELHLSESSI